MINNILMDKTSDTPQMCPRTMDPWAGSRSGGTPMASDKSARRFGPIQVGNRRGSQDTFIGGVPVRRIALDDEL